MAGRVAIVGAGLSGLIAARDLQSAGRDVVVFDKGRRPGGRANTREHDDRRFDHGAQFFTVRDERVRPLLNEWLDAGVVAPWNGRLIRVSSSEVKPAKQAARYVGVPGMVDLALALASELDVRTGVRIDTLLRTDRAWWATDTDGENHGPFDQVVVAVPAPQAVPLLEAAPDLRSKAESVTMAPCWAVMVDFDTPTDLDFDGAFVTAGPISWVARNSSKPGRPLTEAWVVHAAPEWTRQHWDVDRSELPALLLQEVANRFGRLPPIGFTRAHRWGYALTQGSTPGEALTDPELGLGVCGDWCVGGRVEGAIVSGIDVAQRLG